MKAKTRPLQLPVLQIVHVVAWSGVYLYRVMALASLTGAGVLPLQVTGVSVLRSHFFYGSSADTHVISLVFRDVVGA